MSTSKMITLKSSDGKTFDVEEFVALQSQTIKHMTEDDYADNRIPLPNVTSKILAEVIEYCRKHDGDADEKDEKDEVKNWDAKFVTVDLATFFDRETFDVEESVALQSQTIKHMIDDDCADNRIPLPNVTSKILAKVIEYCKKHDGDADEKDKDEVKNWDVEFVKVD
ncbi:hypothetical protein MKX03_012486 [Papaver bracteatum]|nr:hypothetical protein MKX03_012486 [Papaver bracteatum]